MANFLELAGISKRYSGVPALEGVDLALAAGEIHCLAGENGSGKSTLIKIIAGVVQPQPGGRIVIAGQKRAHLTPSASTAAGIQVIYQDLSLFPNLTVAENIAIAQHQGRPHAVRHATLRATALAAMRRIDVALDPDRIVGELPIAQRQLVAICRAMAASARLVIMDEPTASLTRHEVDALLALALELKRRDICVVFVSHRLDEVLQIADRVSVLRNGVKLGTYDAPGMDDRRLAALMTGHEYRYELQDVDLSSAPVVLSVRGLCRTGDYQDIDLDVRAGEIVGITGLLGSGRTELALSLFGMNRPDRGTVQMLGQALTQHSNAEAIAHGIAYVPEDRLSLGLVMGQSVAANLTLTFLRRLAGWLGLVREPARRAAVQDWTRDLAIKVADPANPVHTLSGGNQQRVVLAKWLATNPRLLILDSPTVGVDIGAKDGIYQVVKRLAAEGMAVIMISDEIPEVLYHSHRILVMRAGRMLHEFRAHASSETELRQAVDA